MYVEWIPFVVRCNIGDKGDDDDTANIISSSINVDNIEIEDTDTASGIVRTCDTDVSHQTELMIWI